MTSDQVARPVGRRRWARPAGALLGVPIALVMYVLGNWILAFNGAHAVEGRPVLALVETAALFGFAAWLVVAWPPVALLAGLTVGALVLLGLVSWSPGDLSILELEQEPMRLLRHGAVEPLMTALAVVLLLPSLLTAGRGQE